MEKLYIFTTIFLVLFTIEEYSACFTQNKVIPLSYVQSGNSFFKECVCEDQNNRPHLKWLDNNDKEILAKGPGIPSNVYTEQTLGSLDLYIENLTKSMSGSYKCVTDRDGQQYSYTFTIHVYDPMYFFNTNSTQYIIEGKNSLVTCEARGDKPPEISWQKGEELITTNEKYIITPQGLIIKNASENDTGNYTCTAQLFDTNEGEVDRFIKVKIMSPPIISKIEAIPNNTVTVEDALVIECNAHGYPLPTYSWEKTSEIRPTADKNITWTEDYNRIIFENVQAEDRGTYKCIAENDAGIAEKKISIEVLTPSEITFFGNVTGAEGNATSLICKAKGRPRPKITIMYEVDELNNDDSISSLTRNFGDTRTELELTFHKLNRSHAGPFYCNASNEVYDDIKVAELDVLYKPYFEETLQIIWAWEGKPVTLNCEHDSNPPAQVSWRFFGGGNEIHNTYQKAVDVYMRALDKVTDLHLPLNTSDKSQYGLYACNATNYYGYSQKYFDVIEGSKPPPIRNVSISDMKASSATFFVEGPETGDRIGPPIIGYTAEYDIVQNYDTISIHNNRTWALDRPIKLESLLSNTMYYIRFAAINDVGAGPFTEKIEFTTPEKSAPEPPQKDPSTNSTLVPSNGNRMVLKLQVPENNGVPIDYFAIKYCPVLNSEPEVQGPCKEDKILPVSELPLNDVDYNTKYKMEIVAHNAEGNSTPNYLYFDTPDPPEEPLLSAGVIIAISVVVVVLAILLLDLLLFATRRQGLIASCCYKKNKKKKKEGSILSRDKKGLLKDNGESVADEAPKRPDNGHKEFEYNKTTGVITGKHSAV